MRALAPHWLDGCRLRECWFEPTFHKHAGKLCAGVQIHVEGAGLRPRRLPAVAAHGARRSRRCAPLRPDYPLWRDFPYEYERDRLAIDVINGGRAAARVGRRRGGDARRPRRAAAPDERSWLSERESFLIYR